MSQFFRINLLLALLLWETLTSTPQCDEEGGLSLRRGLVSVPGAPGVSQGLEMSLGLGEAPRQLLLTR